MAAQSLTNMLTNAIAEDGFAIVEDVLGSEMIACQQRAVAEVANGANLRQRRGAAFAIRNLFAAAPTCRAIAELPAVRALVESIIGPGAFVTRAILFDKNPDANWAVPWHQDTAIAVKQRLEASGFWPWSVKAGVQHVQPPVCVLEGMLTMRLHLDGCGEDNSPLHVIPGSHRGGVLDHKDLERVREVGEVTTCTVRAGGALLMRPLLLHSSSPAIAPGHRRVIHLEWAASDLPHGLEWNRA